MAAIPDGVTAHVLPTGGGEPGDDSLLGPAADPRLRTQRNTVLVGRRISRAYVATRHYLQTQPDLGRDPPAAPTRRPREDPG
jgi:NTE family protein